MGSSRCPTDDVGEASSLVCFTNWNRVLVRYWWVFMVPLLVWWGVGAALSAELKWCCCWRSAEGRTKLPTFVCAPGAIGVRLLPNEERYGGNARASTAVEAYLVLSYSRQLKMSRGSLVW